MKALMKKKRPSLRFSGFDNDWEQRKLGATNTFFTDGNYGEAYPKVSDMTDSYSGIPFLTGGNLNDGKLSLDGANYITYEKHFKLISGHLVEDDIVIAVRGSLGALGYVNTYNSGWNINSQLAILRTDKNELYGKFLIQYLLSWSGQNELLKRQTGSALKQLPMRAIKDVEIPITSVAEQKKIGEYFSYLDHLITLHQCKCKKLICIKKSMLENMFPQKGEKIPRIRFSGYTDDWEQCKVGDLLQTIPFKPFLKEPEQDGKYEVIQQGNEPIVGFAKGTPCNDYQDVVIFGDHTLSLYKPKNPFFVATDGVRIVKGKQDVDGYYLLPLLERYKPPSEGYKRYYNILADTDCITTCNADEQKQIGSYFETLDHLITLHQRELEKLQNIKKAMLEKMFV